MKMTSEIDQEKVKDLCDRGICASMGEARRIVMQGAYDHLIKKQQMKQQEEKSNG